MTTPLNLAGPAVARIRNQLGITQEMLSARCESQGLVLSRSTMAKIETQSRCVTDMELLALAKALKVKVGAFFPDHPSVF